MPDSTNHFTEEPIQSPEHRAVQGINSILQKTAPQTPRRSIPTVHTAPEQRITPAVDVPDTNPKEQTFNTAKFTEEPHEVERVKPVKLESAPVEDITTKDDEFDAFVEDASQEPSEEESPVEQKAEEQLSFADDNLQAQEAAAAYDEVLKEANAIASRTTELTNLDKLGMSVPLSKNENLAEYQERTLLDNRNNLEQILPDVTGEIRIISEAMRNNTQNLTLLTKALENITKDQQDTNSTITDILTSKVRNLCDSYANVFKKFENEDRIVLSGKDGQVALTSLIGGIRRVRLYNSGISVNLRSLSLTTLNNYYREANTEDFEYGKMFGAFYYMYSDIAITKYIIENLFPVLICGSNYRHWKDKDKLLSAISFQDFQTILWAAATMMHPDGVTVNFTCAEPGCGHVTKETVDLSKLRLINSDLINDEMYTLMAKNGPITDEDLIKYQEISDLKRSINLEYGSGDRKRKWKVNLKQANLYDYLQLGEDYIDQLKKHCSISSSDDVYSYTKFNSYRVFKPWIESAEITIVNLSSHKEQTYVVNNDGTVEMDASINEMLDEFQKTAPVLFGDLMKKYILDTKISHICFYFPKCPNCGQMPKIGYDGFIPYDAMHSFFTLTLMKLLQVSSIQDTQTT